MSVLVAAGPCLMMAMAAIALLIVHSSVSRVRHALVWAAACALGAAQWGLIAVGGLANDPQRAMLLIANLFGLGSMLLLVEGCRARAGRPRAGATFVLVGLVAASIVTAMAFLPPMPLRAAILPALAVALLGWAASLIASPGRPRSEAELATTMMLLALVVIHLMGLILALGEQAGLLPSHRLYAIVYLTTAEPAYAALALFLLLLIAFDFSAELRRLVHTDPLTGVLNRQGFDYAVSIVDRTRPRAFSVVIADIDQFTEVNDRHGHAAGDATLTAFATHLAGALKPEESVVRLGGEEFALLLPGADGAQAFARIESVRQSLATLRVEGQPDIAITASFGIAEREPGEHIRALIERADKALYQSKRQGRGRTTLVGRSCRAAPPE